MQRQQWNDDRSSRGDTQRGSSHGYDSSTGGRDEQRQRSGEASEGSLQRWADDGGPVSGSRGEQYGRENQGSNPSQYGRGQFEGSPSNRGSWSESQGRENSGRGQNRGESQGNGGFGGNSGERFEPDWSINRTYASGHQGGSSWMGPSHDDDRRSDQRDTYGQSSQRGSNYGGSMGGGRGQQEYDSYQRAQRQGAESDSRQWRDSNVNASSHSADRGPWTSGSGEQRGGSSSYGSSGYGSTGSYGLGSYGGSNQRNQGSSNYGSSSFGGSQSSGTSHRGVGPKGYKRADDRIREDVSEALRDHDGVDASEIEIEVQSGVVTLKGTVGSRAEKRMAEDCAEQCSGVDDVRNDLRVASSSTSSSSRGGSSSGASMGSSSSSSSSRESNDASQRSGSSTSSTGSTLTPASGSSASKNQPKTSSSS